MSKSIKRKSEYNYDEENYKNKTQKCSSYDQIKQTKLNLPIYSYKKDLIKSIRSNQVTIISGDTGCGKSTQLPQYLYEKVVENDLIVACTQPRRVGAISLANRVSEEMNSDVGDIVGYSIRFDTVCSDKTKIIYMTDGVLLRELQDDEALSRYGCIILDEAHERTIQTDTLLGLIKKLLKRRRDLKVVISSATLNTEKFQNYFNNAPIFEVPGRLFKVKIKYCPAKLNDGQNEVDFVSLTVDRILKIHENYDDGDILAFLPGQEEIEECCLLLDEKAGRIKNELLVLPAYSSLPKVCLSKVFIQTPKNKRKVVIATNIAETSLTIEGVKYVIDCGLVKQKSYNHLLNIDQLVLTRCSKAQCNQRTGRAGRMEDGYCFRLFSEKVYEKKCKEETKPEIKRANLANTILQMKSIGVGKIEDFDFIDNPGSDRIDEALEELECLGAIDKTENLTKLGRYMGKFPLEPLLGKLLILSSTKECSEEILIVVAMLCVQNVFDSSRDNTYVYQKRKKLAKSQGDHITNLSIYLMWRDCDYSQQWCLDNCIRYLTMIQARNIRNQLADIMQACEIPLVSCGHEIIKVQDCIGFYYFVRNSARKQFDGSGYRTMRNKQLVRIHPSSVLFENQPQWIVYQDIVVTSDKFMRQCTKLSATLTRDLLPSDMR